MRRALASWFAAGLVAGLALAVVELVSLGGGGNDVVVAALGLLVPLGFVVGLALWAGGAAAAALGSRPVVAALVRALPALPAFIHLGRHLFDGARAATLPGARWAAFWLPPVGVVALAGAIGLGRWLLGDGRLARRGPLAALVVGLALALEVGNRRLFPTGYPDLHLFLGLATCAALAVGVGLALGAGRATAPPPVAIVAWALAVVVVAGLTIAALTQGLTSPAGRALVASHGTHTRHLTRALRGAIDADDDGFSPVLGGGDCDDRDGAINPGAADRPGDGHDQDCDGSDRVAAPPELLAPGPVDPIASWNASPARAALVRRTRAMNVLFVSVDALRADALAAHAPRLAGLAGRGVAFSRALAPGSGTDLALGAVVTGRFDPWTTIDLTLAEALARAGRATHAILPREVLRYAGRTLLGRGWAQLDEIVNDRVERDVSSSTSSVETTDRALAALDRLGGGDRPFLLWVHYFDVHEHRQIEPDDGALAQVAAGHALDSRAGKYHALVTLVDREVGRLLDGVAARGLTERTIVVVFGDHGESLGEDDRLPENHGRLVYQPLVHIPLIVVVPGAAAGTSDAPVSLLDVPATVLDLVDQPPLAEAAGRSLAPLLADGAPADLFAAPRPIHLHDSEQWAVVRWPLKLLVRPADNLVELYDLARDPGETRDLAASRSAEVATLKALHAELPPLDFDRTRKGRARREALARPPGSR